MIDIKKAVSDNNKVTFSFYRDGNLWYKTVDGMEFPVDINDLGSATANNEEKAILFMRYMRKWNETLEQNK